MKEAYQHGKPIAAAGEGSDLLSKADVPTSSDEAKVSSAQGIVTTTSRDTASLAKDFIKAIAAHRHFDRKVE